MSLNGGRGLSVFQKKCFLPSLCGWRQIRSVRHVSCLLERWSELTVHLIIWLLAGQCAALLKRNFDLLGCLVLCLVLCRFLGEWPSFPWKEWKRFLGTTAQSLVRVNVRRILRLNWWPVWDYVGGTGDPAWQLWKHLQKQKLSCLYFLQVKLLLT